jgi:predicted dehydrogenase
MKEVMNTFSTVKKILIVGMGSIGKRHIEIICTLFPNIALSVLRHKECDEIDIISTGVDNCFTNIESALAYGFDAAIIANPAPMHLEVAGRLASNGIHLLIEKPISNTEEGIRDLILICKKHDVVLMTAYNFRFLPTLLKFKELLSNKKIGRILSIRAEVGQYLPSWRLNSDYREGVSAKKSLGGGVLLELSHEIDYLGWLFGNLKWLVAKVSKQSSLEIDVEDTAHIIFGFENKESNDEIVATLDMDFIRHDTTRKCVAIGENGTLRWDGIEGTVDCYSPNSEGWQELFSDKPERNFTYTEEVKHFISCIESGHKPLITGEDIYTLVGSR